MRISEYLSDRLPALGHRNWIVVADAAYPEQTAPGIDVIVSDLPLRDALEHTLFAIKNSIHVRPEVHLDEEFRHLTEAIAPGSVALRNQVLESLEGLPIEWSLHENLLHEVNSSADEYTVIVIKTPSTTAYSSIFMRLECGYWTADQEAQLRASRAEKP